MISPDVKHNYFGVLIESLLFLRKPIGFLLIIFAFTNPAFTWSGSPANGIDEMIKRAEIEECEKNNLKGASSIYTSAFRLALEIGDSKRMGKIAKPLISYHLDQGEFNRAEKRSHELLQTAKSKKDIVNQAWALNYLGNVRFYEAKYESALRLFEESNKLMTVANHTLGKAVTFKDAGIALKYLGKYDDAFIRLNNALALYRSLGDRPGIMSSLNNIAGGYQSIGYTRQAIRTFGQIFKLAEEDGNEFEACFTLNRIGVLQSELLDFESALDSFEAAFEKTKKTNIPQHQISFILQGLSWAHFNLGDSEKAIEYQDRARKIFTKLGNREQESLYHSTIGWIELKTDPDKAMLSFRRALKVIDDNNLPSRSAVLSGIAETYSNLGDFDKAVEYYEEAIEESERMRDGFGLDQRRATFMGRKQYLYQGLIEAYWRRAETTSSNPVEDREKALYFSEQSKSRALLESLTAVRLKIDKRLSPFLQRQQADIENRLARLQKDLMKANVSDKAGLTSELENAEDEFEHHLAAIRKENPRYASALFPKPANLFQIRENLDDTTALLEFTVLREELIAFVVTKTDFRLVELADDTETLDSRIQNYVDLLASGDKGWKPVSVRLEKELLSEIRAEMPARIKRLVIVPDGVLHFLPFETLFSGNDSRFLIEDFEISYSPSATVYVELKTGKSKKAVPVSALIIASPDISPEISESPNESGQPGEVSRTMFEFENSEIGPIPNALSEANSIKSILIGRTEILSGKRASEGHLKSMLATDYSILHFATHGLVSQEIPDRSAILLATEGSNDVEDGLFQAREIYQLRLKSDLVVLSACQTARGKILKGEGVMSLAQAFLYAGSDSVVASLWSVNDEQTSIFMSAFYKRLARGETKSESLRNAKLEMIHNSASESPRGWSAFLLFGESEGRIEVQEPASNFAVPLAAGLGFLILVVAGSALFLLRRKISTNMHL